MWLPTCGLNPSGRGTAHFAFHGPHGGVTAIPQPPRNLALRKFLGEQVADDLLASRRQAAALAMTTTHEPRRRPALPEKSRLPKKSATYPESA